MHAAVLRQTKPIPQPSICDFCSERTTDLTFFRARDFTRRAIYRGDALLISTCDCHTPVEPEPDDRVIEQRVLGSWGACVACAAAVRQGDAAELARIAFRVSREQPNPPVEFYLAVHRAFWLHREGEG